MTRAIIGTKFYVMEMVEGRLFTETLLPSLTPDERRAIYLDLARVLAISTTWTWMPWALTEFGRPGNYYERQIGRWSKQYVASKTEEIEAMDKLMAWLPDNIPEQKKTVIVHGDYRLGNMLIHPTEPKIVAVLDWELSTLGDGLADLGYLCQDYHGDSYFSEGLGTANLARTRHPTKMSLSPSTAVTPVSRKSTTGPSTSSTTCSALPPSFRVSTNAASTAMRHPRRL